MMRPHRPPTLRLKLLLLLLLLSILALTSQAASNAASRVSGEVALFTFDRNACLSGTIPDALSGPAAEEEEEQSPLLGSLAVQGLFCRSTGNGVTNNATMPRFVERVSSTGTAEGWGGLFSSTQTFTVETWLRYDALAANDASTYVIFAMDFPNTTTVAPDLGLLVQSGTLRVVTGSTVSTSVAGPSIRGVPAGNLHVVYTCEHDQFSENDSHYCMFYVNGKAVNDGSIDVRITINAQSRLFFFSEPAGMALRTSHPFRGNVYLWALYSRVLSPAEVTQNYAARVLNSRPIARHATHVVQENGEVGTHYDTPEFYLAPVPVDELVVLTLEVLDDDQDPNSPNYNASTLATTMPLLYLATFPTKGTLYYLNGTAITAGSLPAALDVTAANGTFSSFAYVKYRPGWKEVSWPAVYTNFSFYALDGVTGLVSDTVTVSVQVKSVHEIPKAGVLDDDGNITISSPEAMAGRLTAVTLAGSAYEGFRITKAHIASLPAHGYLYQVNDTNATTPLLVGDELAITPLAPAQIFYLYTGPQLLASHNQQSDNSTARAASISDTLATDVFTYTVTDNFNASSVPGTLNLVVVPSLVALPAVNAPVVPENILTPVRLYGVDYQSLEQRDLCFEITSLPRYGTLNIIAANGTTCIVASAPFPLLDQVSSYPYETGVTVHYISDAGFFTQPNRTWNGSAISPKGEVEEQEEFDFRVVACESGLANASSALPSSLPVRQQLGVQNENAATTLSLSTSSYSIYATTNLNDVTPLGANPTQVVLEGISILDPDMGVDPVLVKISCTSGSLRLNEKYVALADFTSSRYCPTNCLKRTSKLLWFVTTPRALELLLNGLTYSTTVASIVDQIEISIYDGAGPPCLAAGVLPPGSGRTRGCMIEEARVSVMAKDFTVVSTFDENRKRATDDKSYLPYMIAALLLIVLTAISVCACFCCCPAVLLNCRRCCLVTPRPYFTAEDQPFPNMGNALVVAEGK